MLKEVPSKVADLLANCRGSIKFSASCRLFKQLSSPSQASLAFCANLSYFVSVLTASLDVKQSTKSGKFLIVTP
jgi:hypothetical protein